MEVAASELLRRNSPQESPTPQDICSWSLKHPAQGGAVDHSMAAGYETIMSGPYTGKRALRAGPTEHLGRHHMSRCCHNGMKTKEQWITKLRAPGANSAKSQSGQVWSWETSDFPRKSTFPEEAPVPIQAAQSLLAKHQNQRVTAYWKPNKYQLPWAKGNHLGLQWWTSFEGRLSLYPEITVWPQASGFNWAWASSVEKQRLIAFILGLWWQVDMCTQCRAKPTEGI